MTKRWIAAVVLALMTVPMGTAATASGYKEKVECFFYQTFAERDPGDCVLP